MIHSDFSLIEQADRVEIICRMAGLSREEHFSDLIFVVSHGSQATNNPFRQAYGCGACSGNSGAPNARLFVQFANDPQVRSVLAKRGYPIPEGSRFVACHHDTCSDKLITHSAPESAAPWLALARRALALNAAERLQKLKHAEPSPRPPSPKRALREAEARSVDLAQPRPEYGHAGVALAVFGPRSLTEGLDLSRRSFLVSYHREDDPHGAILKEVLVGALPVCANIGLDYFFSSSDPDRLGAGSKLPLNITGLLGVMTGSLSDLRIGLARQMVEIHEPLRMQIIIDADKDLLEQVVRGHPRLNRLVGNEWVEIWLKQGHELVRWACP